MSALQGLKAIEAEIAAATARQRELQQGKATAVREVQARREALVTALEADLDGSPEARTAEKALQLAEKKANEPWDAKIEAAGRLVSQAQRRRSEYVSAGLAQLLEEMAVPGETWPARAQEALDRLAAVAAEYDAIAAPMERLAREAGLMHLRAPDGPISVRDVRRLVTGELHPPALRDVSGRPFTVGMPPEGLEELAPTTNRKAA